MVLLLQTRQDAFTSFKELLTSHKILCAEFLESNYERVMSNYDKLLKSDNYVTRRQSLKVCAMRVHNGCCHLQLWLFDCEKFDFSVGFEPLKISH